MIKTFKTTDDSSIEILIHGKAPKGLKYTLDVPNDHPLVSTSWGAFFQPCWEYELTNGKPSDIYVDMKVARDFYRAFLRRVRNRVIGAYDLNTTKAMERNDTDRLHYISKVKQYLRDLPASIDLESVKTAEEMYLIRPHILFGNSEGDVILPEELRDYKGEAKKYGW